MKILRLVIIFFLLSLSSCIFKPIYTDTVNQSINPVLSELEAIEIQVKKRHLEQIFKNNLEEMLNYKNSNVEKKYLLKVTLKQSVASTYTNISGASGRDRITLTANYQLTDMKTGNVIAADSTYAKDDYNISPNRFADYNSQEAILENLTGLIASNIRNMLIDDLSNNNIPK